MPLNLYGLKNFQMVLGKMRYMHGMDDLAETSDCGDLWLELWAWAMHEGRTKKGEKGRSVEPSGPLGPENRIKK